MTKLEKQADVFTLAVPAGKSEAVFFDEGPAKVRAQGLALRVRSAGSRKFVFFYRFGGKQQKRRIGDATAWTLEKARAEARALRVKVDTGKNPANEETAAVTLLGDRIADYLKVRDPETGIDRTRRMTPRGYVECKRYLQTYWKPLHKTGVGNVTRKDVTERVDEIANEHGPIAAARARSALSAFYAWALEGDDKLMNPVIGSRRIADNDPRERVLSDIELAAVWNASDPATDYGCIVRLLMLTACRREEIAGLRWNEISLSEAAGESWIRLPGERTKNGRPHVAPLSETAASLLRCRSKEDGREFVFGRGEGGFSGYSRAKEALDDALDLTEHWTLHDIRRTVRTRLGGLGVQPHISEAILNHLPPRLVRTYDVNAYQAEKRQALELWENKLLSIVSATTAEGHKS